MPDDDPRPIHCCLFGRGRHEKTRVREALSRAPSPTISTAGPGMPPDPCLPYWLYSGPPRAKRVEPLRQELDGDQGGSRACTDK